MPFVDAACATRAARTPHRALISTPSLRSLPSCFLPRSPSRSLDLPLSFGHQAFILAPIILGHPTYSDQSLSFYPASFSSASHATRCIMRGRDLVSLVFRFRRLRVDVFNNNFPSLFLPFRFSSRPCFVLLSPFDFLHLSFLNIFSYRASFFLLYYLDALLISFGLICNFILKCILHHASIKLNFFFRLLSSSPSPSSITLSSDCHLSFFLTSSSF